MKTETIAAIATAMTNSGIGIIRISGDEAILIADKMIRSKKNRNFLKSCKTHTIHYAYVYDQDEIVDEVMVSILKAPKSYTTEDTVEINCHGGVLIMNRILELTLKNGARLAEPGEFTKRAFLNGRIDLTKAEAIMDIIHSKNNFALKASVHQLKGELSEEIKVIREAILYEIAFIESALDDPEHITLDGYYDKLIPIVIELQHRISRLLNTYENSKLLKEGIHTVIIGKPNAGKSSLLNRLLGEERAIVTEIAGTTRDVLEETISLNGLTLQIMDTAGIRDTNNIVEKIGVEKAIAYAKDADLILYIVDASVLPDQDDHKIMDLIKQKKTILLLNKSDLDSVVTEEMFDSFKNIYDFVIIKTSMKENKGIAILEETIKQLFFKGNITMNDQICITNLRHKEALENAYQSLLLVLESINNQMPEDFLSIDLMSSYISLGIILGEEVGEELVNEIFSKFCMGK